MALDKNGMIQRTTQEPRDTYPDGEKAPTLVNVVKQTIGRISDRFLKPLYRFEPLLFALAIGCSLIPLFLNPLVLSLDGAAHVYNAAVINELIFGDSSGIFDTLYRFNNVPVPNWTGHILLMMLQLFLTPEASECAFWILAMVFTALAFRYIIKGIPHANIAGSYLVFFLFYNHFYLLGFYNFIIATVPFFLLIGYLVRHSHHLQNRQAWVIALLLCAIYFSHGFFYGISVFLVAGTWGLGYAKRLFRERARKMEAMMSALRLFLAALPSSLCAIIFLSTKPVSVPTYLPLDKVLTLISENSALHLFSNREAMYTEPMLVVLLCLALVTAYHRFKNRSSGRHFVLADTVLGLLIVLLVMVFVLPDGDDWGGYYTVRTILLALTMMTLWVAMIRIPAWIIVCGVVVMGVFHRHHMEMYVREMTLQQKNLASVVAAGEYIPEAATLLTFDATRHWLFTKVASWAAARNRAVQLKNYEAHVGYFPLRWEESVPLEPILAGESAPDELFGWNRQANSQGLPIDYILVLGNMDIHPSAEAEILKTAIERGYEEIFDEEISHLYKLKQ